MNLSNDVTYRWGRALNINIKSYIYLMALPTSEEELKLLSSLRMRMSAIYLTALPTGEEELKLLSSLRMKTSASIYRVLKCQY